MTRKEINEIKSQFNIEDCGILKLCGCYVDGEKNKVTTIMKHSSIFLRKNAINI